MSRRALGGVASAVALEFLLGCTRPRDEQPPDLLEWLAGLGGVEKAEYVSYPGEPTSKLILLTLTDGIEAQAVTNLVGRVKQDWEKRADEYGNFIELDIDGFRARFHPALSATKDRDLDRVLWLRQDGRATSSTYGPSGFVVTAPQAAVAAVALGFNQVAPDEEGRRTHRVESADRLVVVEWTQSPRLRFHLDRERVQHLADLQAKYPHLTGWIDCPDGRAGIYFHPDDIELDTLLADVSTVVDVYRFPKLELGWGPARSPWGNFSKDFTGKNRPLLDRLATIPGVTELRLRDDHRPDKVSEVSSVTVRDKAGYVAAMATLRKLWNSYLRISLVREPSPYVGNRGPEVFTSSTFADEHERRFNEAIADLSDVTHVQVTDVRIGTAKVTVAPDIPDDQLAPALAAAAALPMSYEIDLFASAHGFKDVRHIGRVTNRKFAPTQTTRNPADPALVTRVKTAWERAAR